MPLLEAMRCMTSGSHSSKGPVVPTGIVRVARRDSGVSAAGGNLSRDDASRRALHSAGCIGYVGRRPGMPDGGQRHLPLLSLGNPFHVARLQRSRGVPDDERVLGQSLYIISGQRKRPQRNSVAALFILQ